MWDQAYHGILVENLNHNTWRVFLQIVQAFENLNILKYECLVPGGTQLLAQCLGHSAVLTKHNTSIGVWK